MNRIVSTIGGSLLFIAGAAATQISPPVGLKRTDLSRHDISIEGREVIQTRVDFSPGAVAPWHSHPGEEVIYIPEGTLEFQLQGEKPVLLMAGGVLFIPAGKVHMARNPGNALGVELATYIVEKDKPLLVRAAPTPPQ
jgi:quercetin dioxygenase-like cupin family protein